MSDKKEFEKKKLENGVISEDALENIAGGIGMSKESLKKYAKKAGVLVLGAGAIAAAGAGAYYGYKQGWFGDKPEFITHQEGKNYTSNNVDPDHDSTEHLGADI